jgi:hypothetical protein
MLTQWKFNIIGFNASLYEDTIHIYKTTIIWIECFIFNWTQTAEPIFSFFILQSF